MLRKQQTKITTKPWGLSQGLLIGEKRFYNDKSDTPVDEDATKAKADEIKDDVIERLRREQGAKALEKRHKEHANETMQLLAGIAGGEAGVKDERIRQLELENEALRNENNTLKSALLDVSATASKIKNVLDSRKA